MLLKFSTSSYKYDGRVQDEVWTTSNGRGIARTRTRPNPRSKKLRYQPAFSLDTGRSEWANLDEATQSNWEDFAEITFGYPIQGSPRYMDGETFFANYLTVLRLIDPYASVPDVPLAGPDWQDRPKFFEIAEWISGTYTLKAETDFEAGTVLLFSGLPPTASGFKPDFAGEVIIGNHEFESGLYGDDTYAGVHTMMENFFGTITSSLKVWGRVWEVQGGFIRTIKDPCGPDPGGEAPGGDTTFEAEFYNNYWEDFDFGSVQFYTASTVQVASLDIYYIAAETPESYTVELDEGYTTDDVEMWEGNGFWVDYMPWVSGLINVESTDPFMADIEW